MKEGKMLKSNLKGRMKFSQALLVVFLITGGCAFADVTEADFKKLKDEVDKLKVAQLHYISIKSTPKEEGTNFRNDGAADIDSIAIGANVSAHGMNSMVIGNESKTVGKNSIVLGKRAGSLGSDSIIIGTNVFASDSEDPKKFTKKADYDAMTPEQKALYVPLYDDALGTISKYYKIENPSFDASNVIIGSYSRSFGQNNVSLGEVTRTRGRGATALGFLSDANVDGAVALGNESIANREGFSDSTLNTEITKGIFSDFELKNKTYGAVSVGYWKSKEDYKLRQIINLGDATQDTDAVNLRQLKAVDKKIDSVATSVHDLGNVTGENGIKVKNEVNPSTNLREFTVSLDDETKKTIDSIGTGAVEKNNEKTVTGGAVYDYVQGQINNSAANATISYKADGEQSSKSVKLSDGFHFKGDDNIKIVSAEKGVLNYTLNSNLSGIESISNGDTKVTLGKDKTINFGDSKLTNLAEGEVSATSTDAVTGAQLYKTDNKIDMLEKNSSNQMEAINKNAERIENVKNEVGHVGSLSAALAALHPMQYDPVRPNQVMAGLGHYRDKQAVAVGVSHYFNENFMMTAGVSVGNENRVKTMANVGFTWKLGKEEDIEKVPERYQDGPIGSVYVMQQEMEGVLQENRSQKAQLQKQQNQILEQQNEINEMKKQLQMLLKK